MPARPAWQRLLSGSCPSARSFAPRFLPTLGHPHAVARRFTRCDQRVAGLTPARVRPCRAHKKKAARGPLFGYVIESSSLFDQFAPSRSPSEKPDHRILVDIRNASITALN